MERRTEAGFLHVQKTGKLGDGAKRYLHGASIFLIFGLVEVS